MILKDFDLDNHLFGVQASELSKEKASEIRSKLKQEMLEIFYGRNYVRLPGDC